MIISKIVKLKPIEYYNTHLELINPILKRMTPSSLTHKEIELLANFMVLNGDIAIDRFGTTARKIVMKQMKLSTAGLSNYLRSLKAKGFIYGNDILPILFPNNNYQVYQFKLINELEDE